MDDLVGMRREEEEEEEAWVSRDGTVTFISKFMGPSSKVHGNGNENLFLLPFSLSTATIICFYLYPYIITLFHHTFSYSNYFSFKMEISISVLSFYLNLFFNKIVCFLQIHNIFLEVKKIY